MINKIKSMIFSYVFVISKKPIKLSLLLEANQAILENMYLDGKKLGFRLKSNRAYIVFVILVNITMVPLGLMTHELFKVADCHLSIFLAIFITASIFAFFGLFKDWLKEEVGKQRIKQMWKLHFPLFPYEQYHIIVDEIYQDAIENNIQKQELERYLLDELSKKCNK